MPSSPTSTFALPGDVTHDPALIACAARRLGRSPSHGDVVALCERWVKHRALIAAALGPEHRYVHFTDVSGAAAIEASGLLSCSSVHVDTVYAVASGGLDVPSVQQGASVTGFGRVRGLRTHAVVFSSSVAPDTAFAEEVLWHRSEPLPVAVVDVCDRGTARLLLDGRHADLLDTLMS